MRDPHQDLTAAERPLIQKGLCRAADLVDRIRLDAHDARVPVVRDEGDRRVYAIGCLDRPCGEFCMCDVQNGAFVTGLPTICRPMGMSWLSNLQGTLATGRL